MSNNSFTSFRSTISAGCLIGAIVLAAAGPVLPAQGQQSKPRPIASPSRASVSEEEARASWQPVRDLSVRKSADGPAPADLRPLQQVDYRHNAVPISQARPAQRPAQRPVARSNQSTAPTRAVAQRTRLVNQSTGTLPQPSQSRSVMENVPTPAPSMGHSGGYVEPSMPMDGEVIYESMPPGQEVIYDDGYGSQAGGSCGCGDLGCDGSCGGGSCGSSCGGGFCNGNPMCGQYNDCDSMTPCVTLCLPHDGWFSAEYLMWFQDGMDVPPLASTDRLPSATAPNNPGQLLFGGNDEVLSDQFDGLRINFGFWLDNCHTWGIGAEYFQIGEETESFRGNPTNSPALGRPFLNTRLNGAEDIELVNGPAGQAATITGNLDLDVRSQLSGWGIHLRHLKCANEGCDSGIFCGCPDHFCSRTEFMFGFRQTELDEGIFARETLTAIPPDSTRFRIFDSFDTRNQFNGIDLGWLYQRTRGYWTADAGVRLGIGNTQQTVRINGQTIINDEAAQAGGLLAQRSNIGVFEQNKFSVMPQFDFKLGYQLTDQLRATVGYTFLYWSNVVRPGDQIDRLVDPNLLATSPAPVTPVAGTFPRFDFDTTDYWAQGISFGAEYRW